MRFMFTTRIKNMPSTKSETATVPNALAPRVYAGDAVPIIPSVQHTVENRPQRLGVVVRVLAEPHLRRLAVKTLPPPRIGMRTGGEHLSVARPNQQGAGRVRAEIHPYRQRVVVLHFLSPVESSLKPQNRSGSTCKLLFRREDLLRRFGQKRAKTLHRVRRHRLVRHRDDLGADIQLSDGAAVLDGVGERSVAPDGHERLHARRGGTLPVQELIRLQGAEALDRRIDGRIHEHEIRCQQSAVLRVGPQRGERLLEHRKHEQEPCHTPRT